MFVLKKQSVAKIRNLFGFAEICDCQEIKLANVQFFPFESTLAIKVACLSCSVILTAKTKHRGNGNTMDRLRR